MSNFACFPCLRKLSSFATGLEDYTWKYQSLKIIFKKWSQNVIAPVTNLSFSHLFPQPKKKRKKKLRAIKCKKIAPFLKKKGKRKKIKVIKVVWKDESSGITAPPTVSKASWQTLAEMRRKENSSASAEFLRAPGRLGRNPSVLFHLHQRREHLLDTLTRLSFHKCEIHDFDLSLPEGLILELKPNKMPFQLHRWKKKWHL